ncbi:MAG: 2'-deoxycytidine 5'-triphosphate deaminase [Planctomycetota bacterium]
MDGILTHTEIEALSRSGGIGSRPELQSDQVQPTSLDLRLGSFAHRIRAGFLPGQAKVAERLRDLVLYDVDLEGGFVLEPGQIFLVPLVERLALPEGVRARCNPKSSTGRLDIFTRVIADRHARFDDIPDGYQGPLYLEVMPRSFPVRIRAGERLNQVRFLTGAPGLSDQDHLLEHQTHRVLILPDGHPPRADEVVVDGGFYLRISLRSDRPDGIVGYKARRFTDVIDLSAVAGHDPLAFFEPLPEAGGQYLLEPEEFYIFASRERIRVPPHLAAEMTAYDVGVGELRTNYAGFFDAGFGHGERGELEGTRAVLEIRPHDVPFLIEDGQVLFKLEFSRTTRPCTRLYGGAGTASSYAHQGLSLAKQFKERTPGRP